MPASRALWSPTARRVQRRPAEKARAHRRILHLREGEDELLSERDSKAILRKYSDTSRSRS